jgi:hypothetical protein
VAQYRNDKKIIDSGQVTTRFEVMMLDDQLTPSGTAVDSFGRIRISEPYTLFDSTFRFTDDSRNWTTSNTANVSSVTHNANSSSISMTVGTANNASVVRQTSKYFLYQPGKSLLTMNSFTMQPKANVTQRIGYFDENNGIYVENDGETTYIVKRSYTTGSVVETKIPQSHWSEDKFDGTGYSKVNLDFSKSQLFWIDIEWLGVGSVRCGFVIDGRIFTAHKFHHANIITSTYMTTASLPIRYEIRNTAETESNTTLEHICNTIISEGGHSPKVITRGVTTALTGLNMSTTVYRPLVAIRLKANRKGGIVIPGAGVLYGLQNTPFSYRIFQGATITGGTWVSGGDESHTEYNITATGLTGGKDLMDGVFIGGIYVQPVNLDFKTHNSSFQLRALLDGTMETFVIAAIATTNNDDAVASLTWEEYN